MRKLLYFSIGFFAACSLWIYVETPQYRVAGMAAVMLLGAIAGKSPRPVQRSLLVLLGCIAGSVWFQGYYALYLQTAVELDGTTQFAEIRASDFSFETKYGASVDGTIQLEGKPYQVRVYLRKNWAVTPGDYLYGQFRFRVTTSDGQDNATYHQGKGIFLLAYQDGAASFVDYAPTKRDMPALLRRDIKAALEETFPGKTAAFAKALLLGDTTDMDYETLSNFSVSGIRHVLAVSGLHVSILFALISMLTFRHRMITAFVGFPVLLIFAATAGFSPSVTRACIMSCLMLLALLANKEYDGPTALSFAVLTILIVNPLAATSVSLQLSTASVGGIYLFCPGIYQWVISKFEKPKEKNVRSAMIKWMASSVATTVSASIFTIPLCALYFGTVSLISPITNLLVLWVIGSLFYGIMAVCILYTVLPTVAALSAKLLSLPILFVLRIARILAGTPVSAVYTASNAIVIWLIFSYLLLAVFFFCGRRKPGYFGCIAAVGLCLALGFSWANRDASDVKFTVLDVGQGQCLIFQTDGKTFMVDCGGDSASGVADLAAETLLSQGIFCLDGLILTHFDWDHVGAVGNLLSRIDTKLLVLPPGEDPLDIPVSGNILHPEHPTTITAGAAQITIFPPEFIENNKEMNLCILFDTEKCDILVTGDLYAKEEEALLQNTQLPKVDILMAGHHGSKYATSEALLSAVCPDTVCISVGAGNTYGHPAPELLERLEAYGCDIYRTDLQGTILIRR